jgi:hypothetical protein
MLGMVPLDSLQLFGFVDSYFVFHDCASTKMATKKINEVQIWLVLAMMHHFSTRGFVHQSDQKEMTETTAHSNG